MESAAEDAHKWVKQEERMEQPCINQDWTYIGHGEWVQMECDMGGDKNGDKKQPQSTTSASNIQEAWWCELDPDVKKCVEVRKRGYPNRWGARIPVDCK